MFLLTVWPNAETGQLTATRSFRALTSADMGLSSALVAMTGIQSNGSPAGVPPDRNNNMEPHINFPAYGHLINGGPHWINNDVGVGVYLTVRQFNDRINNLRMDRDFLRNERHQLRRARTRMQGALASAASASPVDINTEDWQRHFNAGLGLVPPNVREGQRQSSRRRSRNPAHSEGNLVYTLRHGYARPIPLRPSPWDEFRTNISTSQSGSESAGSFGSSSASRNVAASSLREVPVSLMGNFRRGYSMRTGDDYTPVYSHLTMTSPTTNSAGIPDEVRESPQPNVYTFPIGLFLEGSGWLGGIQSIGIYWPPVSREEEESLAEFRRTENLVPLITEDVESTLDFRTPRYRIEYDPAQLRITLQNGFSLTFIQPGLTLLDAVTTVSNWPRPRPTSGTVYITHLAPFLDAVERLFSHRMRRGIVPTSTTGSGRSGHGFQPASSFSRHYSVRARRQVPEPSSLFGAPAPTNVDDPMGSRSEPVQIETVNAEMYSRLLAQRIQRMERVDSPDQQNPSAGGNYSGIGSLRYAHMRNNNNGLPSAAAAGPGPSTREDPLMFHTMVQRHSGEPFDIYRRRVYHAYVNDLVDRNRGARHRNPAGTAPQAERLDAQRNVAPGAEMTTPAVESMSESSTSNSSSSTASTGGDSSSLASTRRVIRLAVDTATSDVLRGGVGPNQIPYSSDPNGNYPSRTNIARAIESRIERVLNERGNRGLGTPAPPLLYTPSEIYFNHRRHGHGHTVRSSSETLPVMNSRPFSYLSPGLRDVRLMVNGQPVATQTLPPFSENASNRNSSYFSTGLRDARPTMVEGQSAGTQTVSSGLENPDAPSSSTVVTPTNPADVTVEPMDSNSNVPPAVTETAATPSTSTSAASAASGVVTGSARPLSRRRSYSRISLSNSNAGAETDHLSDDETVPQRIPRLLSASARGTTTPQAPTNRTILPIGAERRRRRSPEEGSSGPGSVPRERLSESRHIRVFNS